jgi:aspartate aminotransferase
MAAAAAALAGGLAFLPEQHVRLIKQRDEALAALRAMNLTCPTPEGAFYVFPNIAPWLGKTTAGGRVLNTDVDICQALLHEVHVAAVPGSAFGDAHALRLSYAGKPADLTEALARIAGWAKQLA